MFKCIHCKKQSKEKEHPFTRFKYAKIKNKLGEIVRGNIINVEKNNCCKCFKKLGGVIE